MELRLLGENRFIDTKIFPLHLAQQEKVDLVGFMWALSSQQVQRNSHYN